MADIPNFENKMKYGFLVSEPKKYIGTMFTINIAMILVYIFSTSHDYWYLAVVAAFFHLLVILCMIALAVVDPGIIPKVYSHYEQK